MDQAIDVGTIVAILTGALFLMAGTVGLLRFPDALTRLHALTKVDNLGLGFIVFGLALQASSLLQSVKLVGVWLLVQLSGAIVAQLVAALVARQERSR